MDIASKIRQFLVKLQNLPDQQKKIILWVIIAVLGLTMGTFWIKGTMDKLSKLSQVKVDLGILKTPENQISQPQTDDWKTYTNSDYGFEIKYPMQSGHSNYLSDSIDQFNKNYKDLSIGSSGVDIPTPQGDSSEWHIDVQSLDRTKCSDYNIGSQEVFDIILGGSKGKKYQNVTTTEHGSFYTITTACIEKNNFAFIIDCIHGGKSDNYNYDSFNQMLSTFKFTK